MRAARLVSLGLLLAAAAPGQKIDERERMRRVEAVRRTPGFVALWDFVKRSQDGRFDAWQSKGAQTDLRLDAVNYVRDYWNEGRAAGYDDIPLLGRGPFGEAVEFRAESDRDFRPVLLVPRVRFHGSRLDVKGPGRSVSMVAWLIRSGGNHAIAGIWHEGTDLASVNTPVQRVERGRRQYALFAGLAANEGGVAVHVSENGAASFGDKYARNLAVTPEVLPKTGAEGEWQVAAFTFDNARNTVTAYFNGRATEYWIENPEKHPFFQWPARGWRQAWLRRVPGVQEGEDAAFPAGQFYEPPESKILRRTIESETAEERVELREYAFTRVRVRLGKDARGRWTVEKARELAALRANPFWFAHDLWAPARAEDGGPFTIGRVIHTGRGVGMTGWIGGVAVFDRALSAKEMARLAGVAR
jgi:hypothetical protein